MSEFIHPGHEVKKRKGMQNFDPNSTKTSPSLKQSKTSWKHHPKCTAKEKHLSPKPLSTITPSAKTPKTTGTSTLKTPDLQSKTTQELDISKLQQETLTVNEQQSPCSIRNGGRQPIPAEQHTIQQTTNADLTKKSITETTSESIIQTDGKRNWQNTTQKTMRNSMNPKSSGSSRESNENKLKSSKKSNNSGLTSSRNVKKILKPGPSSHKICDQNTQNLNQVGNQQITLPYPQLKSETQNERSNEKRNPIQKMELLDLQNTQNLNQVGNQKITLPYHQLKAETKNKTNDEKSIPFQKTEFWENPIRNENQATVSPDPQKNGSKNYDVSIYILLAGVVNGQQELSMGCMS